MSRWNEGLNFPNESSNGCIRRLTGPGTSRQSVLCCAMLAWINSQYSAHELKVYNCVVSQVSLGVGAILMHAFQRSEIFCSSLNAWEIQSSWQCCVNKWCVWLENLNKSAIIEKTQWWRNDTQSADYDYKLQSAIFKSARITKEGLSEWLLLEYKVEISMMKKSRRKARSEIQPSVNLAVDGDFLTQLKRLEDQVP